MDRTQIVPEALTVQVRSWFI